MTGINYPAGEVIKVGERVWNLERLYNLREGFGQADDTLPPRLLNDAVSSGPSKGWVCHLEPMLKEYYRARGWTEKGVPKAQKLADLGLAHLVEGGTMIDERIIQQFVGIGRDLWDAQMVSSHGGNLSMRVGDRVVIKRRGAALGRLQPHDLIDTGLEKNDSGVTLASTELLVHRTIYLKTPALAICHCHPRTAIAFSLTRDEIIPIDNEASYLLKKVPVIWEEFASGTPEMANHLAAALETYKIVMLRGHGSFATGQTLEEALFWSSTLEEGVSDHAGGQDHQRTFYRVPGDE